MVNARILAYLVTNKDALITVRELSLKLKIPYMTLSRQIKKFSQQGLVKVEKKGNNYLCRINLEYPLLKHHLILASEEIALNYLNQQPILSIIRKTISNQAPKDCTALLFGSYAKNKQQEHSDVDLAFIAQNKIKLQKMKRELSHLEKLYNKEINILVFTPKQFREMLQNKEENVGKQIFKNQIIIYNPELFWEVVINGI